MKQWYALRIISGQENKVSKLIKSMVEDQMFTFEIGDIHIPVEMVASNRNGKQYLQKRRLLPGYALIELDMPQTGWHNVMHELRAIEGVIGFASVVNAGDKPQALTEEEAKGMLEFGKDGVSKKPVRVQQKYSTGEIVSIIDGPFKDFTGTIETVDSEKMHLGVSVEIFGRITPIELSFEQVEKN